jgi:hypothetical protein
MNNGLLVSGVRRSTQQGRPFPSLFEPVLTKLADELASLLGAADIRLEPVEYYDRPFSHVLRTGLVARGSSGSPRYLFVKIFKPRPNGPTVEQLQRRVVEEFETTRRVHHAMSRFTELGAVPPVACYPEHLAIVTEEVGGETLLAHLQSRAAWLPNPATLQALARVADTAGRWLRAFQSIDAGPARTIRLESIQQYIDLRLQHLVTNPAAHFGAIDRQRILAQIQRLANAVDTEDLLEVPVHADMAPANILLAQDRLVVLDFAMCGRGTVFHDLTRLYMQVDLLRLKPQFRSAVIDRLLAALVGGFDHRLTTDRPIFRLLLLQHRINHLATLSASAERFPASVYNWHVRRYHRALLADELNSAIGGAAR